MATSITKSTKQCGACGDSKEKEGFSSRQWHAKKIRRCKHCVESGNALAAEARPTASFVSSSAGCAGGTGSAGGGSAGGGRGGGEGGTGGRDWKSEEGQKVLQSASSDAAVAAIIALGEGDPSAMEALIGPADS